MEWLIEHGRAALLGVMFLLMVWGIGAAPAASEPQNCAPRPEVGVSVTPTGQVVVSARTSPGVPTNQLGSLAFGTATNAFIDVPGGQTGSRGNFTVTLAPGTQQTSFWVRTATSGQAATVPLVVVDNCGSWSTLVGGALPVATPTALPSTTPTPVSLARTAIKLLASPVAGAEHAGTPTIVSATATPAPTAAANVGISVAPSNGGALSVTIVARAASCTAANQLRQLAFGNDPAVYRNAQVAIDGQVRTPPFTVSLPLGTTQKTFDVLQIVAGQGATVPLVAQDSCGQWNTFVGGGPSVFGPSIEGVPLCTDHDPTRYHSLVQRDPQGAIRCTYGHEHKDDPHVLDSMFGAPPVQDISYPWHSFGRGGNPESHQAFNWAVVRNASCAPASGAQYSFDNFRLEAHFSVINGDIIRFHSYSLQARGCDPADPSWRGTIQMGGWIDYGQLHINSPTPGGPEIDMIVPLPGVDPNPVVDPSLRRLHGSPTQPRFDATWYGRQGCFDLTCLNRTARGPDFNVGLRAEDWGALDPTNPPAIIFYGEGHNHSWHEPGHLLGLTIPASMAVNGFVTYSGFTDRWGNLVQGCTAVGADCIPLIINNMKPGTYQFRADQVAGVGNRDYDVMSPITGKSLIAFPN